MTEFQPGIHYSKIVEGYILGVCLIEPAAFFKVKSITADMFYFDQHRLIFQVLNDMAQQAIPIDLMTVTDYIDRTKHIPYIEDHQTAWFLCRLTNDVIHSAHLKHWCKVVHEMWQARVAARATPETLKQIAKQAKRTGKTELNRKTMRFLLNYVAKHYVKDRISLFGSRIIAGTGSRKMQVPSPLLVFLMSIVEPQYTWTCGNSFDEVLTADQCKARLKPNSLFINGVWINKDIKNPTEW